MLRPTNILKPLKRISPSRFTATRKCPYRVVLANSYSNPLLPYPPANHLGNVIHECIRLILIDVIKSNSEFDENWNRLLQKEEKVLKDIGFGFFTPLSENVTGYTIKKLQVKSLIKKQDKIKVSKDVKNKIKIMTEKWLESKDKLIGGYADIIFKSNTCIKLSDFKSGKILAPEGEIKEEYEDQLKLYAYLHDEMFSMYPDELSIIDLEKKEYSISFTPQECEALAAKSREVLSEINNYIAKDNRKILAKPEPDNCKNCLYRPACDFYWNLQDSSNSIFVDIKGKVINVRQFRNGNVNVTLIENDNVLTVSQINSDNLQFLSNAIGKQVALYNVKKGENKVNYQALKTTKIYEV